jgi:hypothetical protein
VDIDHINDNIAANIIGQEKDVKDSRFKLLPDIADRQTKGKVSFGRFSMNTTIREMN